MKAFVLLTSICAVLLPASHMPVQADEPQSAITCKMDYIEKTWGLMLKSSKIVPGQNAPSPGPSIVLLLEFAKDLDDLTTLKAALGQVPGQGRKSRPPPTLRFYFFDEDNVTLGQGIQFSTQGEVTGKKGDAIRVTVHSFPAALSTIKKIEARPAEGAPPDKK